MRTIRGQLHGADDGGDLFPPSPRQNMQAANTNSRQDANAHRAEAQNLADSAAPPL